MIRSHDNASERPPRGRPALQVIAILAAAIASIATSEVEYPECAYGVAPFEGQTAVAGDALRIVGRDFGDGMPRLGGTAVRLIPIDRSDASVDVAVRRLRSDAQPDGRHFVTWAVEPAGPLAPDTRYRLVGFDLEALKSPHHRIDPYRLVGGHRWETSERVFYTGSAPRLIIALLGPNPDVPTVRLLFSEPMDLSTLDGRISLALPDGEAVGIIGSPMPSTESAHIVDVAVDVPDAGTVTRLAVTIDGDARGTAGGRLHGSLPLTAGIGEAGTDATLNVSTGFVEATDATPQLDLPDWLDTTLNATPLCTTLGVY